MDVHSTLRSVRKEPTVLWIRKHLNADPYAELDSTYHPDSDPDSDFYLTRILIRIRLFTLTRIRILTSKKSLNP
jgi:hypothetical protein